MSFEYDEAARAELRPWLQVPEDEATDIDYRAAEHAKAIAEGGVIMHEAE